MKKQNITILPLLTPPTSSCLTWIFILFMNLRFLDNSFREGCEYSFLVLLINLSSFTSRLPSSFISPIESSSFICCWLLLVLLLKLFCCCCWLNICLPWLSAAVLETRWWMVYVYYQEVEQYGSYRDTLSDTLQPRPCRTKQLQTLKLHQPSLLESLLQLYLWSSGIKLFAVKYDWTQIQWKQLMSHGLSLAQSLWVT